MKTDSGRWAEFVFGMALPVGVVAIVILWHWSVQDEFRRQENAAELEYREKLQQLHLKQLEAVTGNPRP